MKRSHTTTRALLHYGLEAQLIQTAQEATELAHAILKRIQVPNKGLAKVYDEIADVKIMLAQIEQALPAAPISAAIDRKLARLNDRLDAEHAYRPEPEECLGQKTAHPLQTLNFIDK